MIKMSKKLKLWGFQGSLTGQEGAYFYRLPILEDEQGQYLVAQTDDWSPTKNLNEVTSPLGTAVKLDLMFLPGEVATLAGPNLRADLSAVGIPLSAYWAALPNGFALLPRRLPVFRLVTDALNSRASDIFDHEWRVEQPTETFEQALRVLTGNMAFPDWGNLLRQLVALRLRRGVTDPKFLANAAELLGCETAELAGAAEALYARLSENVKRR
jgi:hypothetical protein